MIKATPIEVSKVADNKDGVALRQKFHVGKESSVAFDRPDGVVRLTESFFESLSAYPRSLALACLVGAIANHSCLRGAMSASA